MYKIKQVPEDFIVKEKLNLNIKESGDYIYFILKKKNWTTVKAIQSIAERFKINIQQLSVAGMKDSNAVTTQHVSGHNIDKKDLTRIKIKDISLIYLGYGDKRIGLGTTKCNNFKIIVRNLDKPLNHVGKIIFPNYFGKQRFGGEFRPNTHIIGKYLIEEDYENALKQFIGKAFSTETGDQVPARKFADRNWGKWELILNKFPKYLRNECKVLSFLMKNPRDFKKAFSVLPKQISTLFVHAYESKLWNKELSKFILEEFNKIKTVDTLPFPLNYDKNSTNPNIPLGEKKIVRKAFIETKVKVHNEEKDDLNNGKFKQLIEFSLPPGSYATILLNQLYVL